MLKLMSLMFSLSVFAGCATDIYTPPARFSLLETPHTMAPHDHAVGGTAGIGTEAAFGSVTYRTGVAEAVDIGVDANVAKVGARNCTYYIDNEPQYCGSTASPQPSDIVYSGRLQTKWALAADTVALIAGLGGGHNTSAGSYVSPDVGMILAYPGKSFTPFIGGSVFLNRPFNTQPVDVSHGDDPPGTQWDEAVPTWGWYANVGFAYVVAPPRTGPRSSVGVKLKAGIDWFQLTQLEDINDEADTRNGMGSTGRT
ncbi:MAG: hypothetical protein R3E66_15035 [bacterium]